MKRFMSVLLVAAAPVAAVAQDITGDDLILDGDITQNGYGPNYFGAGNNIFDGRACIGPACDGTEAFEQGPLRLKWSEPDILFEDSSSSAGLSSNDWRLVINQTGITKFAVEDIDGGTIPFTIEGGVPDNTLWLDQSGKIGMGTTIPQRKLHLVSSSGDAGIRLAEVVGTTGTWDILANNLSFIIHDDIGNTYPFIIEASAPNYGLYLEETGNVGMGTRTPSAPLELSGDDSFNFFRITATGAAVNESVDITFTGGPLGTGQLRYNIVDGDNQEMSLDADGNMVLDGTLTTGGPTCSGGCDAVFTEEQIIPAQEYAAQMWADGHLPHVGPTAPGEAFNMTEKMGGMLNALEHAHIYIEALHGQNAAQAAQIAALEASQAALIARLEALEAAGR